MRVLHFFRYKILICIVDTVRNRHNSNLVAKPRSVQRPLPPVATIGQRISHGMTYGPYTFETFSLSFCC